MAVFTDEDEVYTYLGGIFRRGLEKEGLADKLAGSGVVLRVHYTDPDAVVTVDMPNKAVETGASSTAVPNVELFMSADMGNKFWLGKVNLTVGDGQGHGAGQRAGCQADQADTAGQESVPGIPADAGGRAPAGPHRCVSRGSRLLRWAVEWCCGEIDDAGHAVECCQHYRACCDGAW